MISLQLDMKETWIIEEKGKDWGIGKSGPSLPMKTEYLQTPAKLKGQPHRMAKFITTQLTRGTTIPCHIPSYPRFQSLITPRVIKGGGVKYPVQGHWKYAAQSFPNPKSLCTKGAPPKLRNISTSSAVTPCSHPGMIESWTVLPNSS